MGCCLPTLMSPENVITEEDGKFQFRIPTGGLTIIRGYIQQDIPGGTLFVTNNSLVHCTKCCGYNRMSFPLIEIKELQCLDNFGSSCNITFPCCRQCPDSYIVFRTRIDGKEHQIGIKVKDCEQVIKRLGKVAKKLKRQLSVITEEVSAKEKDDTNLDYT